MGTPIAIDEAKGGLDALVCASIDDLVFETPSYTSVMLCPSSERATHLFALFILS